VATNEYFQQSIVSVDQKIHTFSLNSFFAVPNAIIQTQNASLQLFPNPTNKVFSIAGYVGKYQLYNVNGIRVQKGRIRSQELVDVSSLPEGVYFVYLEDYKRSFQLIIKK
jgi:hypothetical protein